MVHCIGGEEPTPGQGGYNFSGGGGIVNKNFEVHINNLPLQLGTFLDYHPVEDFLPVPTYVKIVRIVGNRNGRDSLE